VSLKFVQRTNSRTDVPVAGALTYEAHFGLTEKAFSLTTDARFVYDSPTHVATAQSLLAGIRRREGLLVLTGEIGTGKTTLCRTVLRDLGRTTYSSLVPDPFASREDLLKMLLIDFGVLSIQEVTAGPLRRASRTELGYLLSEFLDSVAADAFAIVVIDEAQNLSLPLIEETRILADTFGAKGRLQIVLVGQPELHTKLKLPEMRQVDQRVCGYHRLAPMNRDAVAGYIEHRLQVAGARPERVLFPPDVIDALHSRSGGVPRLINRVCDRALQLACERRAETVSREILDTALLEIGAATLSPTWDAIVHAQPAPARRAAVNAVDRTPTIDDREDFHKQVDDWVAQDLGPTPAAAAARRPSKPVQRRASPTRAYRNDWPADVRSETYLERLWRVWAKRVAVAAAVVIALNATIAGGSVVGGLLTAEPLPSEPEPPAGAMAALTLPEAPLTEAPAAAAPEPATPSAAAGEFVVAVGVFSNRESADAIVEKLTHAGLPAMQRQVQLRRQHAQQIVLGPYFSHEDAAADLQRLQALGGHDDAKVIVP
jgi:type II secretory pathway predicted ATPase ExeA/cell division septation protein DedD